MCGYVAMATDILKTEKVFLCVCVKHVSYPDSLPICWDES